MLTSPLCRLLPSYRASNRRRSGAARGDRSRRRPNRGGTGSAAGVLRLLRGRNGAERSAAGRLWPHCPTPRCPRSLSFRRFYSKRGSVSFNFFLPTRRAPGTPLPPLTLLLLLLPPGAPGPARPRGAPGGCGTDGDGEGRARRWETGSGDAAVRLPSQPP